MEFIFGAICVFPVFESKKSVFSGTGVSSGVTKTQFARKRKKMSIAPPAQKLLRIVFRIYMCFPDSEIQKKSVFEVTKIDDISKSLSLCGKILLHTFVGVEEVRSHFLAPKLVSLSDYSHPDCVLSSVDT